jgi:hypothetical protein
MRTLVVGFKSTPVNLATIGDQANLIRLDGPVRGGTGFSLHAEQSSGQRGARCGAHLKPRTAQRSEKFRHAWPLSQRQPQRSQPSRQWRFGIVIDAGDPPAREVENGERFQNVVQLRARKIDVHILAPAHAPEMLEVTHAILVQHHAPHRQLRRRFLGTVRRGFASLIFFLRWICSAKQER